jgi:hypothetical protein
MSYITPKIQRILHQQPPHRGFAFKVSETAEGIFLLVKLEELAKFSQGQQEDISEWMARMCNSIRTLKVPCYIMEWK